MVLRVKLTEYAEIMWKDVSTGELPKNNEIVWFIVDKVIYVGVFWEEGNLFCMADCEGFSACDVSHWMPVGATKQMMSFPKNLERVAVDIPQFSCLVTGTFERMFYNQNNGDMFPAVTLDKVYNTEESPCDKTVRWGYVFTWHKIPELPACFTMDIPCVAQEDLTDEEYIEVEEELGQDYADVIDYSDKSEGFPITTEPVVDEEVVEEEPKESESKISSAILSYKNR